MDGFSLLVMGLVMMALAVGALTAGEVVLARRQKALRERYQLRATDEPMNR